MERNDQADPGVSVLLVEDNPDHAELVSRCLEGEFGGRLFHVSDGEQALEFLRRKGSFSDPEESPRPALILMDLRLPKLDGLGLLKRIKSDESLNSIPVVILSTSTANSDVLGAYKAHANAYLAKPLNFSEFRKQLQAAVHFWINCNRIPHDTLHNKGH